MLKSISLSTFNINGHFPDSYVVISQVKMYSEFNRGDLVWFDPGIGYVLPGEVVEFHPQAQVRQFTFVLICCFTNVLTSQEVFPLVMSLWKTLRGVSVSGSTLNLPIFVEP